MDRNGWKEVDISEMMRCRQHEIPITITYQLSAQAFRANFTGNYRPVYSPRTNTKAK